MVLPFCVWNAMAGFLPPDHISANCNMRMPEDDFSFLQLHSDAADARARPERNKDKDDYIDQLQEENTNLKAALADAQRSLDVWTHRNCPGSPLQPAPFPAPSAPAESSLPGADGGRADEVNRTGADGGRADDVNRIATSIEASASASMASGASSGGAGAAGAAVLPAALPAAL